MKKLILVLLVLSLAIASVLADSSITGQAIVVNLLNQNPDPASTGNTVDVRFSIQNIGSASTGDYYAEITPQYPFATVTGENLVSEIGAIGSQQTGDNQKVIKFTVLVDKDAVAGSYNIPLLLYEKGNRDSSAKYLFNINVQSKESAEVIYIDKTVLIPGKEDTLNFTIKNVGSSPLRDLTFSWVNNENVILPVGSDNTKYIRSIGVGDSAELDYRVIANTNDPGIYKLELTLQYEDELTSAKKTIDTIAGIYVGGGTDFDVAFSEYNKGDTSFSVSNVGSNQANSVTVTIPKQQGWTFKGSNSVIIGNLNKGDYTVATFKLSPSGNSTSSTERSIKVDIEYTDTAGNRADIEKNLVLEVSDFSTTVDTSSGNTGVKPSIPVLPIILIVVIIGVLVKVFYFDKKKSKK